MRKGFVFTLLLITGFVLVYSCATVREPEVRPLVESEGSLEKEEKRPETDTGPERIEPELPEPENSAVEPEEEPVVPLTPWAIYRYIFRNAGGGGPPYIITESRSSSFMISMPTATMMFLLCL